MLGGFVDPVPLLGGPGCCVGLWARDDGRTFPASGLPKHLDLPQSIGELCQSLHGVVMAVFTRKRTLLMDGSRSARVPPRASWRLYILDLHDHTLIAKLRMQAGCIVGFLVENLEGSSTEVGAESMICGIGAMIESSAVGHMMGLKMTKVFQEWVMRSRITMEFKGDLKIEMPLDCWAGLYEAMERVVNECVVENAT
jgi:hypothetical protein